MKSIYSIFSAILALCLCFSLAACSGGSSNEKEPEKQDTHSSQNEKEPEEKDAHSSQTADAASSDKAEEDGKDAAIGTMLDKPEKVLELEEFYVSMTYPDDESETGVKTLEIALKDKEEPGILYISDGMLKLHENIYELSSSGDVVKYTKDVFAETFTKDEESSSASLQKEVETLKTLLQRVGYGFVELSSEVKYKKCKDEKILPTGEAYKYELYAGNELIGSICVDKETGIFVKMTNPDGSDVMTVISIETDVNIPAYK